MTVDRPEVKTIRLTGPVTLYEVAAVRESLAHGAGGGEAASDRPERFGTLGHRRAPAPDLLRQSGGGISEVRIESAWLQRPSGTCAEARRSESGLSPSGSLRMIAPDVRPSSSPRGRAVSMPDSRFS